MHSNPDTQGEALVGNMGLAAFNNRHPVGCASASAGSWNQRCFKGLSLCCVCTAEVALQHCSLSISLSVSLWQGCPLQDSPRDPSVSWLCDPDDSSLCPLTCLSSFPQVTAKKRWQLSAPAKGQKSYSVSSWDRLMQPLQFEVITFFKIVFIWWA